VTGNVVYCPAYFGNNKETILQYDISLLQTARN
jgi:hypothetical protein